MKRSTAVIVREYGPFSDVDNVGGVTYDGRNVWFAAGDRLTAFDPATGDVLRSIDVAAPCGHGVRRPASVSTGRRPHPEDRSGDRRCARHDPGARRWS